MTTVATRPTTPPEAPPEAVRSKREILTALSGLLLAMFVAILSSTIVSNALPTIVADLHGSQTGYTWIVTATLLTTTASTPIWGKLSDLLSKKLLVQAAIVIFIVASIGAGFATSMGSLIAWRALQGVGAGGLQALAQVVIAALISPRERGRYSGYLGAVLAAATVSGPLVGGLLVGTPALGWRWCFFVGVPIGLIALVVLQRTLHVPTPQRVVHLDYWGAALITGGVSTLLIWVSLAGAEFGWASPTSLVMAGAGVLLLIGFVLVERRSPEPIMPLDLFRQRTVVLSVLGSLVIGLVMFGGTVFLGQYFQIARSYGPTEAGLLTLPLIAGMLISSTASGQLISRFGRWKGFLVVGSLLITIGLGLLATIDHTTPVVRVGVFLAVLGLGIGMTMQNLVLAVQNTVDVDEIGAASSLVTFLRSMGGTIGVTVLGVVLSNRVAGLLGTAGDGTGLDDLGSLPPGAAEAVRAAYGDGIGLVFAVAAVGSLLTLAAVLFIREVPLRTTVGRADPTAESGEGPVTDDPVAPQPTSGPSTRHGAHRAADTDPANGAVLTNGVAIAGTAAGDRLLAVLVPRPQETLAALGELDAAHRDLTDASARISAGIDRLRATGLSHDHVTRLLDARGVRSS